MAGGVHSSLTNAHTYSKHQQADKTSGHAAKRCHDREDY
jgi:hypothetical protein